ncbi:cell wall hydrolase [Lentibacillus sp. L22]|uniref:cell wall hydrolase n=1 Tax=Lentibacillus TaxID=175304 RepID=UPI0022B1C2ED|nr:cell wall hydrolase [Lentibacillus daqui]
MKKILFSLIAVAAVVLPANQIFAYTVQPGDNLSKIASNNDTTVQNLLENNTQIPDANHLNVGESIKIPNSSSHSNNSAVTDERETLAKLVHAEAGGEPMAGKIAVASVVLNRVNSPEFPDTIHDVIYQPGQFTPAQNGMINNTPDEVDYQSVDQAFANRDQNTKSLYFYNPTIATDHWLDHLPTTEIIGDHVFKQ